MRDNVRGFYVKLSDIYDTRDIIRHVFTRIEDKHSKVHLSYVVQDYLFVDWCFKPIGSYKFDKFFDFMYTSLFFDKISFAIFPFDKNEIKVDTYKQYQESDSIFACKAWDYVNVVFLFKNHKELEAGFEMCKKFKFDDLCFITDENIDKYNISEF